MRRIAAFITAALMLGLSTAANAGDVVPDNVVRIDVLPGWETPQGTRMAALRIRLAPGWKTYWRAPGDAGIPPRFGWKGSRNLSAVRFHWPVPDVFDTAGMQTIGYTGDLVLPMELTPRDPSRPIRLRGAIEIGVCEDICLPWNAPLQADLPAKGEPDPRIYAALADQAVPAASAGSRGAICRVEPISDGLRLTATLDLPPLARDEVAVVELPDQTIWVSQAKTSRQGRTLTAVAEMVPPSNAPFMLDRSSVRVTVIGNGRAVDFQGCTAG